MNDFTNVDGDGEFERKLKALWADSDYVFDALLHAVHQDEIVHMMVDSKAYDSIEAKAKFWDKLQEVAGQYIIDKASDEETII